MLANKSGCFFGKTCGKMFSCRSVIKTGIAIGGKIFVATVGSATVASTFVDVKAVVFGPGTSGTKVPLAGKKRCVTVLLKRLSECGVVLCQLAEVGSGPERAFGLSPEVAVFARFVALRKPLPEKLVRPTEKVGIAGTGWPLTCEDRRAGRRTDWAGGIAVSESHAGVSKRLDVGGVVETGRVVGRGIHHAKVVSDNKDNVQWLGRPLLVCKRSVLANAKENDDKCPRSRWWQ